MSLGPSGSGGAGGGAGGSAAGGVTTVAGVAGVAGSAAGGSVIAVVFVGGGAPLLPPPHATANTLNPIKKVLGCMRGQYESGGRFSTTYAGIDRLTSVCRQDW